MDCHGSALTTQECETLLNPPLLPFLGRLFQGAVPAAVFVLWVSVAGPDSFQSPVAEGGVHAGGALPVHLQGQEFSQSTLVTLYLPEFPEFLSCSMAVLCYSSAVVLSWVLHGA